MNAAYTKTKVLITVKTYPHPSQDYRELVCTAGITEDGQWVRLYPVDFRYQPRDRQFKKYQWIAVGLADRGSKNDWRKESRRPDLESIRILGEPLNTQNNWEARRDIIDKLPVRTLNEFKDLYEQDKTSLGVIRPTRVRCLKIEETNPNWNEKQQSALDQLHLIGPERSIDLIKIPFNFRYVFECEDSSEPHTAIITDWEVGALYLKELERLRNEQKAAESVKRRFFNDLCGEKKDTHFFIGTVFPYNQWIVLGVFWPPKDPPKKAPIDLQPRLL